MEKMRMESVNLTEKNINNIALLFPNVITVKADGKIAINFDLLKQMLSDEVLDGDEAYEFTWVGKKASILEANKPIRKTLRPCIEESKNWDTTENLYIEGDNLDVLKLLQESYLGAVKMIYIDPPYNTGKDFIYRDKFEQSFEEYQETIGILDEENNRLYQNNQSNGRFHSDWCSLMLSRLTVSHNLLTEDGLIFISIDDSECHNLRKICDEVFGASNFIAQLVWQNKKGGGNDSSYIAIEHEYILVYAKNKNSLKEFYEMYSEEYLKRYKEQDEIGKFYWDTFKRKSGKQYYPITCPDGTVLQYDEDGNLISWLRSEKRFYNDLRIGDVRFVKVKDKWSVQFKQRLPLGKTPRSIFTTEEVISDQGTTSTGSDDVFQYFKKDVFSNPKPVELLEFIIGFGLQPGEIILDFFSGSGTIAEAVMKSNEKDNGKRKYIAIQIREDLDQMLEKAQSTNKLILENAISVLEEIGKPHYITEIAKERIRRAGEKIESKLGLLSNTVDTGFRVFVLDDTNMKDVYYSANELSQNLLDNMISNIKEDRNDLDLLFGCLLEWGLPLSLPHHSEDVNGITIHIINDGDLIACFADAISEEVIREIAKRQPLRAVFRDSSFINSPAKINVEEIFKLLAPNTSVKVI